MFTHGNSRGGFSVAEWHMPIACPASAPVLLMSSGRLPGGLPANPGAVFRAGVRDASRPRDRYGFLRYSRERSPVFRTTATRGRRGRRRWLRVGCCAITARSAARPGRSAPRPVGTLRGRPCARAAVDRASPHSSRTWGLSATAGGGVTSGVRGGFPRGTIRTQRTVPWRREAGVQRPGPSPLGPDGVRTPRPPP